jgi:hypothetical protein
MADDNVRRSGASAVHPAPALTCPVRPAYSLARQVFGKPVKCGHRINPALPPQR